MAAESEVNEQVSRFYHAAMRDGSIAALGRDAVKDVRSTIMEMFFGKPERGGEPGTPLNPLFHDIVQARNYHSSFLGGGTPPPALEVSTMAHGQEQASVTAAILDNPQAFLTPEQQGQQHGNVMGQDGGGVHGVGPEPSVTAAILGNPQSFLSPEQQHGQEHQQQHEHGMER
jgi:hypothetical protein